ncbi:MAG: ABC transporter permease [Bacteroidota bacterium]
MLLRNYLVSAWRNISRQKVFSFINIFGLATGMAAFIMLLIYIRHEVSFDRFHQGGDRIYRVISSFGGDQPRVLPRTLPVTAAMLVEQSPWVESALRMKPEVYDVRKDNMEYSSIRIMMTDSTFADIFSFDVLSGNLHQTLTDPSSVAITSDFAKRIFGDTDPINQEFELGHHFMDTELRRLSHRFRTVKVGAVVQEIPSNTHLRFNILQSFEAYDPNFARGFSNDVFVFFKTTKPMDAQQEQSILRIIKEHALEMYPPEYRDVISYDLQKLHDIHFGPRYGYDTGQRGNLELIYVFMAVAFFILFIAIINFINLVTARSEKRAVEAAIRKVAGAGRFNIVSQFLGEAILISIMAFTAAIVLAELAIRPFSNLLDRDLNLSYIFTGNLLPILLISIPLVGMLAGIFPALLFSRYHPAEILRGKARGGHKNPLLRIILVVVQFAISVILIVSIMVFNRQIHYMKNADLGFSSENIIVFGGLSDRLVNGMEALRAELLQSPGIISITTSQTYPGRSGSGMSLRRAEDPASADININEIRTGPGFFETYRLKLVEGRWFDFESATDLNNFIINQAAAQALGLSPAAGTEVVMWQRRGKIIGVVEDFHNSSLRTKITPVIFSAYSKAFYFVSVKFSPDHHDQVMQHIRTTLASFDPNYHFSEWYLENYFHGMYREEENNNKILNYASLLAIIIAMTGIFGLSSFMVMARRKETGIRKVLGASSWQIARIIFTDIVKWVLLANIIAWPIAWYAMNRWLENYPYRIDMSLSYLLIAGCASILIVAVTIASQTVKAARSNPVDALKSD